jgi:hypothetical protein
MGSDERIFIRIEGGVVFSSQLCSFIPNASPSCLNLVLPTEMIGAVGEADLENWQHFTAGGGPALQAA